MTSEPRESVFCLFVLLFLFYSLLFAIGFHCVAQASWNLLYIYIYICQYDLESLNSRSSYLNLPSAMSFVLFGHYKVLAGLEELVM